MKRRPTAFKVGYTGKGGKEGGREAAQATAKPTSQRRKGEGRKRVLCVWNVRRERTRTKPKGTAKTGVGKRRRNKRGEEE